MNSFLSENGALLIAILGLLISIIGKWDAITEWIRRIVGPFDRVPFLLLELLAISFSGTIVASIFWMMIDLISKGKLTLNFVLFDLASGAAWGIPLALMGGLFSKSTDRVVVTSVLTSVVLLLWYKPEVVMGPPGSDLALMQIYAITLFLFALMMGVACGYAGFRTKSFIDSISTRESKRQPSPNSA